MKRQVPVLLIVILSMTASPVFARQAVQRTQGEQDAQARPAAPPPLFFKEAWKQTPEGGEHPVTLDVVSNPNLELKLYGAGKDILVNGTAGNERNPIRLWTGVCSANCAAALRDKNNYADLTGHSRIRWITRTSGFHFVHPILKLAGGTWLVGDYSDGSNGYTRDYHTSEFFLDEVHWLKLDIDKVVAKGEVIERPDLSKVDEIGFTDMMPGSGHGLGGFTGLASIEVYGKPVPRDGTTQSRVK
jgi:hypothetical protein